jgi:hypothetical protein
MFIIFLVTPVYCQITDGLIGERRHWRGAAGTLEAARQVVEELSAQDRHDDPEVSFTVTKDGKEVVWWEPVFLTPASPTLDIDDLDSIPF